MRSGDTLASKAKQLVNLQYVIPRVKYIAGGRKTWKPRKLDDETETVSELSYFRNTESRQETARVGVCIEFEAGMGPSKTTRRTKKNPTDAAYQRLEKTTSHLRMNTASSRHEMFKDQVQYT